MKSLPTHSITALMIAALLFLMAAPSLAVTDHYAKALAQVRTLSDSPNVRLLSFGRSREGRAIPVLAISDFDVSPAHKARVFLCAGQHGDEPNPVKSLLALCARIADGTRPEVLRECVLIVVPVINPDGLAKFRRLNADGTDINRDWIDLSSREARFVNRLIEKWKPQVLVDMHEWTGPSQVPGDEIEVAPCAPISQEQAMHAVAARVEDSSRLSLVQCRARGNASLFHRRYAILGYGAYLVETGPDRPYPAKDLDYRSAVMTLIQAVCGDEKIRLALSPASSRFDPSIVSAYLDNMQPQQSADTSLLPYACVLIAGYFLMVWAGKPQVREANARWSRRFKKCSFDEEVHAEPLMLKRLQPITARSWVNRRIRARYAVARVDSRVLRQAAEKQFVAGTTSRQEHRV